MIYTSENNWYSWNYGDGPKFGRQLKDEKLHTSYSKFKGSVSSFSDELLKTASSTLDYYPNIRPSILFSGGVDSEIVLRSYLKIGANPKVYIIRYENDYNIYDVSYAITICSLLNVEYTIIDFNLKKFYENDAEKISKGIFPFSVANNVVFPSQLPISIFCIFILYLLYLLYY